ncbi:nucleolar and coiled-body phosphoprotein 1-like isoform X2 [Prorops nasuta]|uniref:nucleolar and coiled-body phosphoprotein 1-like isoform X2 n=1 Tax=Prorops nasuta TaxID=863751 RepID=UPI0034CE70DA
MDSIGNAGRSVAGGVCRIAGSLARGTRRIFSWIPFFGFRPFDQNGEEAESAAVTSPVDEKSSASSPSEVAATTTATKTEVAEEKKAATEEKEEKKCSSAAPLAGGVTTTATAEVADVVAPPVAVPNVEEKKQQQEVEVERSVEKKAVEVSGVAEPLEVRRVQPIATPSIIERKTSEDHPPLLPSSPPPTPIDPSPLQQARQAAASATALAEALKLPAETAREKENQTLASSYLLEDQTSPVTPNITPIPTSNVPPSADEPSNNTLNSSDPEPKLEDNNIVKEEISIEPVDDSEQLPADLQLDNVKEVVIEPTDVPSEVVENIEIVADPAEAFPNPEQATPLLISDDLVTAKPTLVIPNDQSLVAAETIVIVEKLDKGEKEIIEIAEVEDSSLKEADEDSLDLPPAPPVPEDQLSRNCTYYDNSENDVSIKSDGELPPAPFEGNSLDFNEYPLPPEELCSINSDAELPPNPAKPMNSTEVLLTPPQSLSPQSSQSFTSASMAKERSQGQFYESLADDQSNQEFKTESISLSLNSYADSEIELKERLADQEKTQLSNGTGHQDEPKSVLEAEATVEEVTKNIVTTESLEEAPKVAPPAIPSEPEKPTAPAITEDVTSVTKILEGNDISDKAIAAAVNDAIECNTNEMIVADANHQNNLNE